MENVDSFAQEYMERARQRREMLTKKLADTSPRRKRSIPLGENTEENVVHIHVSEAKDDDSPNKRQCLREDELSLKADTPAIPGVRSRLSRLANQRRNWDNGDMDMDHPAPTRHEPAMLDLPQEPALRDKSPAPSARKNRLAALAQNINEWQDDSNHPVHKKEEKTKKTWQPPKEVEIPTADEMAIPKRSNGSPTKPTRAHEYSAEPTRQARSPVKPARSPVKMMHSPLKEYRKEGDKVVSSLTVKLGSNSSLNSAQNSSPKKVTPPSPKKEVRAASPVKQPSAAKPKSVAPTAPAVSNVVSSLRKGEGKNRRESFEPSAQPVSARLARWQDRVDQVESESMDHCNNAASRMKVTMTPKPMVNASTATIADEPTEAPVHSRMANWEHKVQQEEMNTPKPKGFVASAARQMPATPRAKSPQKAAPAVVTSPLKSPSKVAPATKGIHQKLQKLQENWKENEISEKIKEERKADLNVLENRWKNGVLNEENYSHESKPKPSNVDTPASGSGSIPAPPPLPNMGSPTKRQAPKPPTTNVTSPIKHVQAPTGKTPKQEARNRIRQEHSEMIAQVMGEDIKSDKPANESEHFEQKLKTLGFEVDSQQGHVATLDLKEQREADRRKREAEKNKLQTVQTPKSNVKVTEQFVTTVKFDTGEKVTRKEVVHTGAPSTTTVRTTATPSGGSLYGLIKKQGNGPPSTPTITSKVHTTPGGASATRSKFHDSFSSDETSFEEDVPSKTVEIKQHITFQPSVDESTASDDDSELQEGDTETQSDEYSDSEEGDMTEYTMDETVASSQSDRSYDEGDISDTETEASSVTQPVVMRRKEPRSPSPQYVARKLPPETHPAHPDHRPSAMGTHQTPTTPKAAPPKHPRLHEQQQSQPVEKHVGFISPGGSTYRSNSSGSEKSIRREKPYSIDNYRNSANVKRNAPEPKMTIIRRSEHFDPDSAEIEQLSFIPEESAKQKIKELQELVTQEQNVIMQTSNALNQCCGSTSAFAGSQESVECHRLLLQACKKREAYIAEMQKLKSQQQPALKGPKGSLTISDIRLPLKNDFVANLGTVNDNTIHYFMVLFRHGAHVIFTQMVSTHDAMIRGSLDIPNLIKLNDVRQDFVVDMEIYHMSITREMTTDKTPKKKKGMTPKKMMSASKKHHPAFQSPGGPQAVRTTNFTFIASMPLTMKMVDKTHFNLDRVPFSSPLQGTIHMRLRCLMEVSVEEKGFLTMFEDVSGLGAWHRRWCVLRHNVVSFWKYPDDAKHKDPIGTIDLKCCISDEIGLVPRDVCARPNTLELLTVRRQQRGESDTLVSRCYNTMTTTKHWISADTKDDRAVWAIKLNEALRNLRAWNPDALRPIKRQQKQ